MVSSRPLIALSLLFLLFSGCGDTVVEERRAGVYSFTLVFDLNIDQRVGAVFSQGYEVPDITPDIVDDGAVILYFWDQETWTALPFTIGIEAPEDPFVDYIATLAYGFDDAFLEVFLEASTDDAIVWEELDTIFGGGLALRAVIIEGVPLGQANVDLRDYEAVQRHFGLEK